MNNDIRWKQRFENFTKALAMLHKMLNRHKKDPADHGNEIALIGAFLFTFELGWKTLRDYMSYMGIEADSPRDALKKAFDNALIIYGKAWIAMLEDRNIMAHSYDQEQANIATHNITVTYIAAIEQVHSLLQQKREQ